MPVIAGRLVGCTACTKPYCRGECLHSGFERFPNTRLVAPLLTREPVTSPRVDIPVRSPKPVILPEIGGPTWKSKRLGSFNTDMRGGLTDGRTSLGTAVSGALGRDDGIGPRGYRPAGPEGALGVRNVHLPQFG